MRKSTLDIFTDMPSMLPCLYGVAGWLERKARADGADQLARVARLFMEDLTRMAKELEKELPNANRSSPVELDGDTPITPAPFNIPPYHDEPPATGTQTDGASA